MDAIIRGTRGYSTAPGYEGGKADWVRAGPPLHGTRAAASAGDQL